MNILGIGVDVVHIPRISALIQRRGSQLAKRILSEEEHEHWAELLAEPKAMKATKLDQARFMAVRWSVKEAAYKAMYPTVRPVWKELTYRRLANGQKPSLLFHPVLNERRHSNVPQIGCIHVSVSHDGDYVFTSVLIESSTVNKSTS